MISNTKLTRRRALIGIAGVAPAVSLSASALASAQVFQRLHILVPAAAGGGWDQTARAVADAVTRAGLVDSATLEHVSGGGGARAISYLLASGQPQTLMVGSTPMVLRAVRGASPSYRDLKPVAALTGDYSVIAVHADSPYRDFAALAAAMRRTPGELRIAGGSVRGGMDHVLAARIFGEASGIGAKQIVYFPYDAGGGALDALLSRQVHVLSTGLGEVLENPSPDGIRVLGVTASERVPDAAGVPTLREFGHDVTFVNWRGFFTAPQTPDTVADAHADLLGRLVHAPEWETIRKSHAWQPLYQPRSAFAAFLEAEEVIARRTLSALGMV